MGGFMLTEEELKDAQDKIVSLDAQIEAETDAEKITELTGQKSSIEEEIKKETPEEKMARLETENVAFTEKEKTLLQDQSLLGRRYKELQEGQDYTNRTIQNLNEEIANLKTPKKDTDFRDLNDPLEADKWFNEKVNERIGIDNKAQREYSNDYERRIKKLEDDDSISAEERKAVHGILEKQKDNIFNDPQRDAEWNFKEAQRLYYREQLSDTTPKNLNLKRDKLKGGGVGGDGTIEPTKKKADEGPEATKIKAAFAMEKKMRGWQAPVGQSN